MAKEKGLDPAGKRKYLVNITTRTIHRSDSPHADCRPESIDKVGFSDDFVALRAQRMLPCALCQPS